MRYPPPQKGYLGDTCAIPFENKANGCDTPLCDTISKGYCAIWGGISHWAAKIQTYMYKFAPLEPPSVSSLRRRGTKLAKLAPPGGRHPSGGPPRSAAASLGRSEAFGAVFYYCRSECIAHGEFTICNAFSTGGPFAFQALAAAAATAAVASNIAATALCLNGRKRAFEKRTRACRNARFKNASVDTVISATGRHPS